jgi:hypothetical protein
MSVGQYAKTGHRRNDGPMKARSLSEVVEAFWKNGLVEKLQRC